MGKTCSRRGIEEDFCGKVRRKETIRKTMI
jgi:hypothetical protein